jgi:cytochrome c-type biogenesis protein CcmH/NrfF
MKRLIVLALALAALGVAADSPEQTATEISQRIMSPYCPGVTLHDCSSGQAVALRDRIEEWARDGLSEGQIEDRLVAEFGPQVLAVPPASGFNLLAWLVPAAVTLFGGIAALTVARRWRGGPRPATLELEDADRQRVESELRALERKL